MSVTAVLFCLRYRVLLEPGAEMSCVETEEDGYEVADVWCYISGIRMVRRENEKGR